uniref:Uncharacterized protein n=1 Tax=Rhizophora mucronata TaxID=61149 RepID=A0A2P2MAI3_RHIMU
MRNSKMSWDTSKKALKVEFQQRIWVRQKQNAVVVVIT